MNADILTVVAEFGRKYGLFDTENIIIGLSGGPDSVALITILSELKREAPSFPDLYAVHVNHNLRDAAADDEALARRCAERLGIPFIVCSVDVKGFAEEHKRSEEESGRILRYQAYDDAARELFGEEYMNVSRIAVAHHRDDLAETVMMNLFRGCGLEGLVSPQPANDRIIRPLLCISKKDIVEYLNENEIEYATDETNLVSDRTRNIWRNELLPAIGEVSVKDPEAAIADTYELLGDDLDYIKEVALCAYEDRVIRYGGFISFICKEAVSLHPAIRGRVIRLMWEETFGDLVDFETVHLNKVIDLIASESEAQRSLDLGRGRQAVAAGGFFVFCHAEEQEVAACTIAELMGFEVSMDPVNVPIFSSYTAKIPQSILNFEFRVVENNETLEYNDLSWVLPIYPDDGDDVYLTNGLPDVVFRRAGSSFSKKARDLLSDLKVPRDARAHVVMVVRGDQALWIPGAGHSVGFTGKKTFEAWSRDPNREGKPGYYIAVSINDRGERES